jgi:HEAT repeat protein
MSPSTPPEARVGKWLARLRAADPAVRVHAALRLAALGSEAEPARPALAEALAEDDPHLRKLAGWVLAQLGAAQEAA